MQEYNVLKSMLKMTVDVDCMQLNTQAAQAHYVWVRASEVIWLEYTRIISILSDAK